MSWLDDTAVFARHWIWDKEPVFHLRRPWKSSPGGPFFDKTRCGLVLYESHVGEDKPRVDCSISMRREHAEKFARPCRRCVPL